ncbi:MAG TPA: hypothetical protein VEB21_06095 [Terriglobales bacterium]|nr:hypothetical protein [Terriglobales bacterium]
MPDGFRRCCLFVALTLLVLAGCSEPAVEIPKQSTPIDPATAGTIRVAVSYQGAPPAPKPISLQSAPACAQAHPEPVYDESLVVAGDKLVNAVVWIKGGLEKMVFAPPQEAVEIDQIGCLYKPHVISAMVHQPVAFLNSDSESHNVHGKPQVVDGWNFIMSRKGSRQEVTFDQSEIAVPVGCDIHPWMRAYVAIAPTPYHGVTGSDGVVELAPLPPGEYVVAAWHEKLGTREQRVQLAPSGSAAVAVTFGEK